MSRLSDLALTKQIYEEYREFLKREGIRYYGGQHDLHVCIPVNGTESFTQVSKAVDGKVLLADYCGDCYSGNADAQRLADAIRERFPKYEIQVMKLSACYELAISREITYTGIEALHEAVLGMAEVVSAGAMLGRDMLGGQFERE